MTDATIVSLHGDQLPWTPQAEAEQPTGAKPDDERMWSVTTIISNVGDAGGLVEWACGRAADCAIDQSNVWRNMIDGDQRAEARKFIAGARRRPRPGRKMTDADIGKRFHRLAEQWIYDGKRPACDDSDVNALLNSFGRWLDTAQPVFEALEMTVYHPDLHYAGTLDGIVTINGLRAVIDYKTSLDLDGHKRKQPWKTVALQLAAYRHAQYVAVWKARVYERFSRRYYLLSPAERAMAMSMPVTDTGLVLHVTPDHADTYIVATGEQTFEAFLAAIDATAWFELEADGVFIDQTLLDCERNEP